MANEADTAAEFLARVLAQLDDDAVVFCVLDTLSRDGTRGIVQRFASDDARVREVWAPQNRCVVDAYVTGYHAALESDCDWILEMDAGLSHLPEEMPRFLEHIEDYNFIAGSRFCRGGMFRGPMVRWCYSRLGTLLTNLVLGTRMHDMTSGFQCFQRTALEHVLARGIRSRQHFFQTEIRASLHDWNWLEVPITYTNPSGTPNSSAVFEALRNLFALFRAERIPYPQSQRDSATNGSATAPRPQQGLAA